MRTGDSTAQKSPALERTILGAQSWYVRRVAICRKLLVRRLASMNRRQNSPHNLFAAWLCLFAAVCLYAPLTLSAWSASPACCDAGICAMPEHHHRSAAADPAPSVQCDHHEMANCSIACCDQQGHAAIAPVAYLLPGAATIAAPALSARLLQRASSNSFFVSRDLLYPPPRA
jgi:hypothetical protein